MTEREENPESDGCSVWHCACKRGLPCDAGKKVSKKLCEHCGVVPVSGYTSGTTSTRYCNECVNVIIAWLYHDEGLDSQAEESAYQAQFSLGERE